LRAEEREVQHRLVSRLLSQLCSRVTCVSCRRWTRATRRDTPVRRAVHADDQLAIVVGRTKLTTFAAVDEIFLQSLGQRFEWKSLSFGDTRIFVQRNIGQAESCLYAETSCRNNRFNTIPASYRHADRHGALAFISRVSLVS